MITIRHLNRAAALAIAGLTIAGLSVPATATETTPNQDRDQHAASTRQRHDGDQRKICVRAQLTGSRMMQRICKTAAQWDAEGGVPTDD